MRTAEPTQENGILVIFTSLRGQFLVGCAVRTIVVNTTMIEAVSVSCAQRNLLKKTVYW